MTLAIPAFLGALAGLGVLVIVLGWIGALESSASSSRGVLLGRVASRLGQVEQLNLRLALGALGAILVAVSTGWIIGSIMAALAAATAPTLIGAKRERDAMVDRTEALATWAEQLRDTIASASGLREAIAATADVAPAPIAASVRELEVRLRSENFAVAVRRFAESLGDPTGDKISVALLIASERRGQRLTEVLSEVARAARQHAEMQLRMEASRARTYTQALTVTGVLVTMFILMIVFSRDYLAAYDTFNGQLVLLIVLSGWAAAFIGLVRMSRIRQSERVLNPSLKPALSAGLADSEAEHETLGIGIQR